MKIFRCSLVLFLLIFSKTGVTQAQQQLNLDFETLSVEGTARPWGWSVYSYAPEVSFVCDSMAVRSGVYSMKIHSNAQKEYNRFELSFFVEPNQVLNSILTLEAFSRTDSFFGKAGISIRSEGIVGDGFGILKESELPISNSDEWKQYRAAIRLEGAPHSVIITLFFEGSGTVWFDDLRLKVNGKVVTEVPVAKPFNKDQLRQLEKETAAFRTVDPVSTASMKTEDFKDLKYFSKLAGDARIIALGESTHGTSEFFRLKHRLLQYAVMELGVRVFILEDNQLLTERINEYVLSGKGEATEVIRGLFAVWNTEEMLSLIKWVRDYNIAHPSDMLEFVGMDEQNPQLAMEHLDRFLQANDKVVHDKSNELLSDIKKNWRNSFFTPESTLNKWDKDAGLLHSLVFRNKDIWMSRARTRADSAQVEWAVQNARVIKQFIETALGGIYEGRDKAMAENVSWILEQRKPGTKAVVWAHDSHVSRGDHPDPGSNFFFGSSMGSYLSRKYGDAYRAFGLFTYQGTCLGTISYSDFAQKPFRLYTSPKGSLDEALHQISEANTEGNIILDLRPFKDDSEEYSWLLRKRPVRYVGYVAEDYGFGGRYSIPYQFDGILFVDHTSASRKVE